MKHYRLPSGKTTVNLKRYLTAWRKLHKTAAKVFGRRVIGFDPGILLEGAFDIPTQAAIQLWQHVNARNERIADLEFVIRELRKKAS